MPKTFLITMEDAPATRWWSSNAELCQILQGAASFLAASNSTGPRPKVECKSVDDLTAALDSQRPEGIAPGMMLPPSIAYLAKK